MRNYITLELTSVPLNVHEIRRKLLKVYYFENISIKMETTTGPRLILRNKHFCPLSPTSSLALI